MWKIKLSSGKEKIKLKIKRNYVYLFFISLLFLVAGCSSDEAGSSSETGTDLPEKVTIGYLRLPNDEILSKEQAYHEKYFEEKGIETNFIVFDSGVEANQAFASGGVDFASMGHTNGVVALSRNIDVELIWLHQILGETEGLAVRDDSDIKEISDLKGKKIATTFASTSHYSLLQVLKEEGIEDEVELLDMQTVDIVAAWERGDVDAAYTWQPSLGALLDQGSMLISSKEISEMGHQTANIVLGRKGFTTKYPELTIDYIATLVEGGDFYRAEPEEAAMISADALGISSEEATIQMEGSLWLTPEEEISAEYLGTSEVSGQFAKVMKNSADFLFDEGVLSDSPSQEAFEAFINPTFIEMYLERER